MLSRVANCLCRVWLVFSFLVCGGSVIAAVWLMAAVRLFLSDVLMFILMISGTGAFGNNR